MGIAAYNRGSTQIRRELANNQRLVVFEIMERLNALEKYGDCGELRGAVVIKYDRGVWHLLDKEKLYKGYGYWYPSLEELMRRWSIEITGYDATTDTWSTARVGRSSLQKLYGAVFGA